MCLLLVLLLLLSQLVTWRRCKSSMQADLLLAAATAGLGATAASGAASLAFVPETARCFEIVAHLAGLAPGCGP